MWGSPFMTEAMTSLQDISNDKEEDEKIRWTASESIALIGFGQKAEDFEGLKARMDALEKLSCSIVYEHWLVSMVLKKILRLWRTLKK